MYVYAVAASFYKLVQESAISGLRWQHRWQKEVLTGGGQTLTIAREVRTKLLGTRPLVQRSLVSISGASTFRNKEMVGNVHCN